MTTIRESIRRLFTSHKPLPPGTYPYQAPPDAPVPYRLHLRLEDDGSGVLIVNASTIVHLNPTAAEYAYHIIKGTPEDNVARTVSARYRVNRDQALKDYHDLINNIKTMATSTDLDPETYMDFERKVPYSQDISAPYRLDCALTYRLSPGVNPADAPVDRVKRELSTDEWKTILDKTWDAGIPHVVFTGGEPTLRDDLFELLTYVDLKGQVSGLITDGLRMANPHYVEAMIQPKVGLDHLMMILQPEISDSWTALRNLLGADLFVAVHLTLTPQNSSSASQILEQLTQLGVSALSLSASTPELHNKLQDLRNYAANLALSLVWDLPVPYSSAHPVALELSEDEHEKHVEGAGKAWLYVEPDGDVLPGQGVNRVMGNFLNDPWEKIWAARKD